MPEDSEASQLGRAPQASLASEWVWAPTRTRTCTRVRTRTCTHAPRTDSPSPAAASAVSCGRPANTWSAAGRPLCRYTCPRCPGRSCTPASSPQGWWATPGGGQRGEGGGQRESEARGRLQGQHPRETVRTQSSAPSRRRKRSEDARGGPREQRDPQARYEDSLISFFFNSRFFVFCF